MLLPVLRVMKPVPEHYRFLMVRHQDSLWKRHPFEAHKRPPAPADGKTPTACFTA